MNRQIRKPFPRPRGRPLIPPANRPSAAYRQFVSDVQRMDEDQLIRFLDSMEREVRQCANKY